MMGSKTQEVLASAKELISARRYSDAVKACRRVLLSRPHEVSVRLLLAQALLAMGRHDEVRIEMLALLKRAPEMGAVHRLLGEAHLRGGNAEEAAGALRTALHLDPEDEEARELLDELGEVDSPPKAETIDRWFGEPATVESALNGIEQPEGVFEDETDVLPPGETRVSPSVELDPEFERELTNSGHEIEDEETHAPISKRKELPARRPARPTAMGIAGLGIAPLGIAPPKSSLPPPPPGASPSRVAAPPSARPSRPGFGRAPDEGTVPLLDSRALPTGTAELSIVDIDVRPGVLPSSTSELDADDLLSDSLLSDGRGMVPASTSELSMEDLELGRGEPATEELGSADLAVEANDPYEALGDLPPLEGEATQARAPLTSGPPSQSPQRIPSVPPPSFDDETSRGKRGRTGNTDPADVMTTTARPAVKDFPEDDVGGDLGLPPLEGEATLMRGPAAPDPFGMAPSATPIGHPVIDAAATPMGLVAPVPAPHVGLDRPQADAVTKTPITPPTRSLRAKLARISDRFGGRWPPGVLAALFGVPVLLVVLVVFGINRYIAAGDEDEINAAARRAADEGTIDALRDALELDADVGSEEGPARARRALLYSMAVLEHGAPESERAGELLLSLPQEDAELDLARIARAYLSLEAGEISASEAALASVPPRAVNGEGDYARALTKIARGDIPGAAESAREALNARPTASRYAALLAYVLAMSGDSTAAAQLADEVAQGGASPTVTLARLWALQSTGRDDEAKAAAEALLALPMERASRRQRAFAQLVLAGSLERLGERDAATSAADRAAAIGPEHDERFALSLAQIFLDLDQVDAAKQQIEALPNEAANVPRRATVSAEVYLASNDLDAVERVLTEAGDSSRTAYLRGRLAEAKNEIDAAKAAYEAAAQSESEMVAARTRLGAIALAAGDDAEAIQQLEPAHRRAPGDPELTTIFVRALLQADREREATAAVDRALEANPEDPRIQGARAEVQMAFGRFDEALATFTSLVTRYPDDADLQASLGDAARHAGQFEQAAAAYDRCLALDARNRRALLGKVEVAISTADPDLAEAAIEAARAGGSTGPALDLASGKLKVLRGEGAQAVEALERLIGRGSRDVELLTLLGRAQAQAEDFRDAQRTFERVIRVDRYAFDAHIGLALTQTMRGELRSATRTADQAARIVERNHLGPVAQARVDVARGRVRLDYGNLQEAETLARSAIEKDARSAEAHLLLALIADYQGEATEPHLRRAMEARAPMPEVFGRLVLLTNDRDEKCALSARYLAAAPHGVDARDVERTRSRARCR